MKINYSYEIEINDPKYGGWRCILQGNAESREDADIRGRAAVDYYTVECGYESRYIIVESCATCGGTKQVKGKKFMSFKPCPDCQPSARIKTKSYGRDSVRRDLGLKATKYGWE